MKRNQLLPELLAPAGNMECLVAAILGGADAIYVGGVRFGARAFAKNFEVPELCEAVRLCHLFGVRLYVTLNTAIFDKEISEALEYAKSLHAIGVDAVIISDLGLMSLIKKEIPDLELHASTQMGIHNREGADLAYRLGCRRVVLARECSGVDIKAVTEASLPECEVFVHGALCVCHSGQCLFSSMVGGRSGNRGECAQPCRLPYNGKYPLSLKDLSLSAHINELIDSGVSSLKIEGRMKSPSYVYEVTSIYRRLLDEHRPAGKKEQERLLAAFSRGGFTDGYFVGKTFSGMLGVRSDDDKRLSRELQDTYSLPKIRVSAEAVVRRGEPSGLKFSVSARSAWDSRGYKEPPTRVISVSVSGAVPSEAINAPLDVPSLAARLGKLGNTPFELSVDDIVIELDEGINLPPSAINALRRDAVEALLERFSHPIADIFEVNHDRADYNQGFDFGFKAPEASKSSMIFFDTSVALGVIGNKSQLFDGGERIFVPLFDYSSLPDGAAEKIKGVYIPPVIMESEWQEVLEELRSAVMRGALYALIGNISHLALAADSGITPVGDFRLNITNKYTASLYRELGVSDVVLSPELTLPQARDIGGRVITLGRIPLMLTERCFTRENFGCDDCGKAKFRDRKGAEFPIMREHSHRNIIFNSSVTYMGDKADELRNMRIHKTHFIFSVESEAEISRLLSAYNSRQIPDIAHRRIGKR